MVLLRENFVYLQTIGLWSPVTWPSDSWKSRAYRLYTTFLITATYWFGITESISLFTIVNSIEDFSDSCFMLLTTIVVCFKVDTILSKKSEIVALIEAFEVYPHKPMNADEERIQTEFQARIRLISCICGGFVEVSAWIMTISVFFQEIPYGDLPYKAWIPYSYSKPGVYWFTFCLQLLVVVFLANVAIGFDTIIYALFLLICSQFNILLHRVTKAIDEFPTNNTSKIDICERKIIDCVVYHRAIFKISAKINLLFRRIIFVQYTASTIVICFSVFMISQVPLLSTKALFFFLYFICMLTQIFVICALADEVTVECENVIIGIYNTKWYHLTNRTKGYLVLMMVRTLRPVVFTSGHIIVLSLNSFSNLLKRSYSIYTVLQQNSK
ncbi:odorant receptor 46a [Diachasma alloeum]|uniref:Odorant receptor n=1 Tax=Diachasma alloeum TaxID=454923 RepID=A0A4E0RSJ0_9HYME|nr:odorant receptor 46a [Diachasma alloeum]THK32897.1 odorant receptor 91 [Diachasma alloeum]